MTKEFAQFLVDATENAGNQEIKLREDYCGRGMYNRTTCAVIVDNPLQLISDIVTFFKEGIDINQKTWEGKEIPDPDSLVMDQLGMGYVIY